MSPKMGKGDLGISLQALEQLPAIRGSTCNKTRIHKNHTHLQGLLILWPCKNCLQICGRSGFYIHFTHLSKPDLAHSPKLKLGRNAQAGRTAQGSHSTANHLGFGCHGSQPLGLCFYLPASDFVKG